MTDQEDAAFLEVDKTLADLKTFSLASFQQEFSTIESDGLKNIDLQKFDTAQYFKKVSSTLNGYFTYMLTIEKARAYCTKEIITYYRQMLIKYNETESDKFFSTIRHKPELLTKLGQLSYQLRNNDNPIGWQTNAANAINLFINSATNSTTNVVR